MLTHFIKLRSPLQAALQYQSLDYQEERFLGHGWSHVEASSLWDVWSADDMISPELRGQLDTIEPFDEWEEFALFASHYFLLLARNDGEGVDGLYKKQKNEDCVSLNSEEEPLELTSNFDPFDRQQRFRRHGVSSFIDNLSLVRHGGIGAQGRLSNHDEIVKAVNEDEAKSGQRTCRMPTKELVGHTLTELCNGDLLLVGGRASPERASRGCYLLHDGNYSPAEDLPFGLYRHAAVPLQSGVLVYGGKRTSSHISNQWLFWRPGHGWQALDVSGDSADCRFGHSMVTFNNQGVEGPENPTQCFISGGLGSEGRILSDLMKVDVAETLDHTLSLRCRDMTQHLRFHGPRLHHFGRFGGKLINWKDDFYVLGGVCCKGVCTKGYDMLRVTRDLVVSNVSLTLSPNPMLIGFELQKDPLNDNILIFGGGATCFSFGTFWNQGVYEVCMQGRGDHEWSKWRQKEHKAFAYSPVQRGVPTNEDADIAVPRPCNSQMNATPIQIRKTRLESSSQFCEVRRSGWPIMFEGLELGACLNRWTPEYLKHEVGEEHPVCLQTQHLDPYGSS